MDEQILLDLTSLDADTRLAAIRRAPEVSSVEVLHRLEEIARDVEQGEPVRQAAAEALGQFADCRGAPILLAMLGDPDPHPRVLGAIGLTHCPSPDAVQPLIDALDDGVNTVRNAAERALLEQIEIVKVHGVLRLLDILSNPNPLKRSPAARILGGTQDPRARDPLMAVLRGDREWLARMWAAKALGDLGQIEAADLLHERLDNDEKNRVRAAAAEAIGKLRPPNGAAWLLHALEHDDDGGVRKLASEALRLFGMDVPDAEDEEFFDDPTR